jgi:hypothetical protein
MCVCVCACVFSCIEGICEKSAKLCGFFNAKYIDMVKILSRCWAVWRLSKRREYCPVNHSYFVITYVLSRSLLDLL